MSSLGTAGGSFAYGVVALRVVLGSVLVVLVVLVFQIVGTLYDLTANTTTIMTTLILTNELLSVVCSLPQMGSWMERRDGDGTGRISEKRKEVKKEAWKDNGRISPCSFTFFCFFLFGPSPASFYQSLPVFRPRPTLSLPLSPLFCDVLSISSSTGLGFLCISSMGFLCFFLFRGVTE